MADKYTWIEKIIEDLYLRYCTPRVALNKTTGEAVVYYEWTSQGAEELFNYYSEYLNKEKSEDMKREAEGREYLQRQRR